MKPDHLIVHVSVNSLANWFAVFYGVAGSLAAIGAAIVSGTASVPIGFVVPFLNFTFNLHTQRGTILFVLLLAVSPLIFAFTGYLSGYVCGVAYNWLASHGIGVKGRVARVEPATVLNPE